MNEYICTTFNEYVNHKLIRNSGIIYAFLDWLKRTPECFSASEVIQLVAFKQQQDLKLPLQVSYLFYQFIEYIQNKICKQSTMRKLCTYFFFFAVYKVNWIIYYIFYLLLIKHCEILVTEGMNKVQCWKLSANIISNFYMCNLFLNTLFLEIWKNFIIIFCSFVLFFLFSNVFPFIFGCHHLYTFCM